MIIIITFQTKEEGKLSLKYVHIELIYLQGLIKSLCPLFQRNY